MTKPRPETIKALMDTVRQNSTSSLKEQIDALEQGILDLEAQLAASETGHADTQELLRLSKNEVQRLRGLLNEARYPPRTIWEIDPGFSADKLGEDTGKLHNSVRAQKPHDRPEFREMGLMGDIMSRSLGGVSELYTFYFHETGDPWYLEGVLQLWEPYARYFRGEGSFDPTKYREFTYDLKLREQNGEPVFAGVTTPGATVAQGFVNASKKWWFRADQGLAPIAGRAALGFRDPVPGWELAGFRKGIYWRPDTSNITDLSTVGTPDHDLDFTQWLAAMAQAALLAARNPGHARAKGAIPTAQLARELWDVILEQWERIAYRKTPFYEEYGLYKMGSTITHSAFSTRNLYAYCDELWRHYNGGLEHPIFGKGAESLTQMIAECFFRVEAPNGHDCLVYPHWIPRLKALFSNTRLDMSQAPHVFRYTEDLAPEILKAFYLGSDVFDEAFLRAAANNISQLWLYPLGEKDGKPWGQMPYQIDNRGQFVGGKRFDTPLGQSKTLIPSDHPGARERKYFRLSLGGLFAAFDPTEKHENLGRWEEYAKAFADGSKDSLPDTKRLYAGYRKASAERKVT
jgi:hypothetical protein